MGEWSRCPCDEIAFRLHPEVGSTPDGVAGAAVAYLGALVTVAFLYSSPIVLIATGLAAVLAGRIAGARDAVRAALRMALTRWRC